MTMWWEVNLEHDESGDSGVFPRQIQPPGLSLTQEHQESRAHSLMPSFLSHTVTAHDDSKCCSDAWHTSPTRHQNEYRRHGTTFHLQSFGYVCVCVCMWTAEHFDIHCSHFISATTVEDRHFYCHFPMKATKGVERKGSRATWPTFNARLTTHFGKALNFPLCLCFLICNGNKYNNSVLQDLNELI